MRLPAGAVITDEDGHVVRHISITPVPVDQPPFTAAGGRQCADLFHHSTGTGLFVLTKTDPHLPGVVPIGVTRTYRQNDSRSRSFGIGATHQFDIFLAGDTDPYTYADLILPDGGRVHYTSPAMRWCRAN